MKHLDNNQIAVLCQLVSSVQSAHKALNGPREGETERLRDYDFIRCLNRWSDAKDSLADKVCEYLGDQLDEHRWVAGNKTITDEHCGVCGAIRRTDRKNSKTCRGTPKVGSR